MSEITYAQYMENEAAMWRKELIEAEKTIATLRQRVADLEQALAMVQPVVELQRQVEAWGRGVYAVLAVLVDARHGQTDLQNWLEDAPPAVRDGSNAESSAST